MLTEIYVKDWLAKVFYFIRKKTGNREDAEELAADISLAVLESLSGNPPPEHFSSWLWTIASRRFARWCAWDCSARSITPNANTSTTSPT